MLSIRIHSIREASVKAQCRAFALTISHWACRLRRRCRPEAGSGERERLPSFSVAFCEVWARRPLVVRGCWPRRLGPRQCCFSPYAPPWRSSLLPCVTTTRRMHALAPLDSTGFARQVEPLQAHDVCARCVTYERRRRRSMHMRRADINQLLQPQ